MKIVSLKLTNFQGHVDSVVEFSEFFNCIVGATNSGKSSIVRALMFVAHNQWYPDYVNKVAKKCSVKITFDNGISVERSKGPKVNEVSIQAADGTIQTYKEFGTTYPKAIQDCLAGISGIVDDLILNFADQDDMLFLLKSPNAARIKLFGQLMGIGVVDKMAEDIRSDSRKTQLLRTTLVKSIAEKTEALNKMEDVCGLEEMEAFKATTLQDAKQMLTQLRKFETLHDRIEAYKVKNNYLKIREADLSQIPELERVVTEYALLEKMTKVGKRVKSWQLKMESVDKEIGTLMGRIQKGTEILSYLVGLLGQCPTCGTKIEEPQKAFIIS